MRPRPLGTKRFRDQARRKKQEEKERRRNERQKAKERPAQDASVAQAAGSGAPATERGAPATGDGVQKRDATSEGGPPASPAEEGNHA